MATWTAEVFRVLLGGHFNVRGSRTVLWSLRVLGVTPAFEIPNHSLKALHPARLSENSMLCGSRNLQPKRHSWEHEELVGRFGLKQYDQGSSCKISSDFGQSLSTFQHAMVLAEYHLPRAGGDMIVRYIHKP